MNYTSIKQNKRLLELGLSPESADLKFKYDHNEHRCIEIPVMVIVPNWDDEYNKDIPCWSVGALLEVMPKHIFSEDHVKNYTPVLHCGEQYVVWYQHMNDFLHIEYDDTLINACYKMIIWLLENNYTKKGE